MTNARDRYQLNTAAAGVGMHQGLVKRYVEYQTLALAVIAPHWSEHIWLEVLKKGSTVQNAAFSDVPGTNAGLSKAQDYVTTTTSNITSAEGSQIKRQQRGKATTYDPKTEKKLSVYCSLEFPEWQDKYIEIVRRNFETNMSLDMKEVSKSIDKADSKKAMPFIQGLKKSLDSGVDSKVVFDRQLPFDEAEVLKAMAPGLASTVPKCIAVEIVKVDRNGKGEVVASVGDGAAQTGSKLEEVPAVAAGPAPGQPTFFFENV